MENITEKAKVYAEEKFQEAFKKVIATAYIDGYNCGLGEAKELSTTDDGIEYVDLGLPSGTKWASDSCHDAEGNTLYLPQCKAKAFKLPSKEQVEELFKYCRYDYEYVSNDKYQDGQVYYRKYITRVTYIGPNGNYIKLYPKGYYNADSLDEQHHVYFWLTEDEQAANLYYNNATPLGYQDEIMSVFPGYHLPILQVQK